MKAIDGVPTSTCCSYPYGLRAMSILLEMIGRGWENF